MTKDYDAIVVGARCAGSPTAMLLARKGHKVLVVDRATFPSDMLSTHIVHAPGVAALKRWSLLDRLASTGCPEIPTYTYDFGFFTIQGSPRPVDGVDIAYCPRRTVLDKLLVDAAREAGAEVREGFTVEELLVEDGRVVGLRGHGRDGVAVDERAKVVIGADGRHSFVARAVHAERYNEKPPLLCAYYAYWDGVPLDGAEIFIRPERGFAAFPTHDGQTVIVCGWPMAEFEANRTDIEGNVLKTLDMAPEFAARVRAGTRVSRFAGTPVENFFRVPFGPGWALVGDAGYDRDPITGMGINDAWRDAELCANALDECFLGLRSYEDAMRGYQTTRDTTVMPMYELTTNLATLQPPPPEMQQVLAACSRSQDGMNAFVSMMATTMPVQEFFATAGALVAV